MYVKIAEPEIAVFDVDGQFVGLARFQLPSNTESALLDLVNNQKTPQVLFLLNVEMPVASKNYRPPNVNIPIKRKGILRAEFVADTGDVSLIEIHITFDSVVRGGEKSEKGYFFNSVQYSNINVDSVNIVTY
jgi:hypothetical protein